MHAVRQMEKAEKLEKMRPHVPTFQIIKKIFTARAAPKVPGNAVAFSYSYKQNARELLMNSLTPLFASIMRT